eukprot:TRINITY_DN20047_c0_g2_i1.p1 TRINITY_DN20047_c0_g2~~TRINITY_DN20047_c0_g2_i1.p1  ORF type:complete len:250 (-),score=44.65 TRINITY_DN20047_c0_g2_i1:27-734(-)
MADPSNLWSKLWLKSQPIPAHKQEPLFDHIKEAEFALDFLSTMTPKKVVEELAVVGVTTSLQLFHRICQYLYLHLPAESRNAQFAFELYQATRKKLLAGLRNHPETPIWKYSRQIRDELSNLEIVCARVVSLSTRMGFDEEVSGLVDILTRSDNADVVTTAERRSVLQLFSTASDDHGKPKLPEDVEKEFTLVGLGNFETSSPGMFSESAAQRMYVRTSNKPKQFCLATAWGSFD